MKVLWSGYQPDGRGKLGGTVFSRNRGGAYARNKVTPVNPQTVAQSESRARFGGLSQAWRGLSPAEQQSWRDAAPNFPVYDVFGNELVLQGNSLFIQLNSNLSIIGEAQIDEAPTPTSTPLINSVSVTLNKTTGVVTLTFTPTPVPALATWLVFATAGMSPGRTFAKNLLRLIDVIPAAQTSPYIATTGYTDKYGAVPAVGQKVSFWVVPVSTLSGQQGVGIRADAIVSA